jgi:hypothetical protein
MMPDNSEAFLMAQIDLKVIDAYKIIVSNCLCYLQIMTFPIFLRPDNFEVDWGI